MKARVVFAVALVAIAAGVCAASDKRVKTKGSIDEFETVHKMPGCHSRG